MALRDRATELDLSASSIAGIAAGIRREISFANAAFNNSGITNVASWNARFERINLESNLSRALETVRNSDRLFHADRVMQRNPGRFQTADQVDLYERRMQEIAHPIAAKRRLYRDTYGDGAGIDLLNAEYRKAYDDATLELTDPRRSRLNKLTEQFGNSARARTYLNRESAESFRFAMLDKDEQFIQGAMRDKGWSRDQAEQVYFKNLTENTKWLRFIARDNPKIAKNLIPIAKAVGKASGLPFIGGLFANPMTAITALGVGAIARTVSGADEANATIKKWKAYEGLYGNPTDKQKRMARLAGINDVTQISKVYGRLNVRRGDAEAYLTNMGMAFRTMDERSIQLIAEREGLSPEEVRLAKLYAGEGASRADVVDANIEYLKEVQQRGFETGSGVKATIRSLELSIPYVKSAIARGMVEGDERFNEQLKKIESKEWGKNRAWGVATNYQYDDPQKYQAMVDAINRTWNEVHDAAIADDQYAAGKFETYTDTTDNSRKEVNVQMNLGGVTVQPGGDARGFVDELISISTNGMSQSRAVVDAFDTKRKK